MTRLWTGSPPPISLLYSKSQTQKIPLSCTWVNTHKPPPSPPRSFSALFHSRWAFLSSLVLVANTSFDLLWNNNRIKTVALSCYSVFRLGLFWVGSFPVFSWMLVSWDPLVLSITRFSTSAFQSLNRNVFLHSRFSLCVSEELQTHKQHAGKLDTGIRKQPQFSP